jgi:hypothetical protein
MSSILLEGTVGDDIWTGQWHFFKDNKIPLNFRYKRTSVDVPLDLIHYVSFVSNNGSDMSAKPRSRGRAKGWRKYQHASAMAMAAAEGEASAAGTETGGDALDKVKRERDVSQDDMLNTSMEDGDDDNENADAAGAGAGEGAEEDAAAKNPVFVTMSGDHPLFGLYEGSFDVKAQQGPLPIDETFFLHSYAGSPKLTSSGMDMLPSTDWWGASQLLKHMELDANKVFGELCKDRSSSVDRADRSGSNTPSCAELKQEGGDMVEVSPAAAATPASAAPAPASEGKDAPANGTGTPSTAPTTCGETALKISILSTPVAAPAAITAGNSATHADSSAVWPNTSVYPDLDFVLGFGRNSYGRFSLFGVYNRTDGSLKCERKYLSGRTAGLRKNIRSGSISGLSVASGDYSGEGTGTPGEPRMTTRTHRVPSFYLPEEVAVTPRASSFQVKSERSFSLSVSASEDNLGGGAPAAKRRRTASSVDLHASAGAGTPTGQGAASTPTGRVRSSSSAGSEAAAALAEADRDFNDISNTTVRYRPVYFDEESSSYYEGWWCSGYRNGRGLCLYSDKLMYEGNWLMGRETGRGVLMTGTRQVLYRGDWVDGCFHGHGTYTFTNGDTYKGDWREGKRHGKGEYFMTKYGCSYIGDWKDNQRHGRGVFLWADGSRYDGDWEKDYRHGRGILTLANGFYYDGSWDHNFFDGRGYSVFPNGQEYQGK